MLCYPKIPDPGRSTLGRCIAFEKYDGTNLHWDWHRELGWHSFGTRRDAFDLSSRGISAFCKAHNHLKECVEVFYGLHAERLAEACFSIPWYSSFEAIRVFTEFLGPNSFAGFHKAQDEKTLILFDVWLESFGFVGPECFVQDFAGRSSARVVYRGKFTGKFAEDVRNGKYGVGVGL